jgi:hypothetical protein
MQVPRSLLTRALRDHPSGNTQKFFPLLLIFEYGLSASPKVSYVDVTFPLCGTKRVKS